MFELQRAHQDFETRERRLLGLLIQGLTDNEIARMLGVVIETVREWIRLVLLKTTRAARWEPGTEALRLRLLQD